MRWTMNNRKDKREYRAVQEKKELKIYFCVHVIYVTIFPLRKVSMIQRPRNFRGKSYNFCERPGSHPYYSFKTLLSPRNPGSCSAESG